MLDPLLHALPAPGSRQRRGDPRLRRGRLARTAPREQHCRESGSHGGIAPSCDHSITLRGGGAPGFGRGCRSRAQPDVTTWSPLLSPERISTYWSPRTPIWTLRVCIPPARWPLTWYVPDEPVRSAVAGT